MQFLAIIFALIFGFFIGAVVAWLFAKNRASNEREQLKTELAELKKEREFHEDKLQWVDQAEEQMREAFESLASKSLQTNSDEFIKRANEQVDGLMKQVRGDWNTQKAEFESLVDPLQKDLDKLQDHIRELEQKREGAYEGLKTHLESLARAHGELQQTTTTLAQALKSPTVRGRWGEFQLRRVVEMAGMVKHVAFSEQVSTDNGRPDMVIHLPNSGIMPVDAKVPMEAYLDAMEVDDPDERQNKLSTHAKALKGRVRELSLKQYWSQFETAPDFVIMFVPNEACLSAAFEQNSELLEYAIGNRVLITTPVTLLALLKAVAYGWQQIQIAENAKHIAEQGQVLYDRLGPFTNHLIKLGKSLDSSMEAYNSTIGSFEYRILPAAREFEEMGIASDELPQPEKIDVKARLPEAQD